MASERKHERTRDILLGGVLGAFAALAAIRRRKPASRTTTAGLAAFEDAPCYREAIEAEAMTRRPRP